MSSENQLILDKSKNNMKKYKVWLTETNSYSTTVEANNTEEAKHLSLDEWRRIGIHAFKFEEAVEQDVVDIEEVA